MEDIIRLEQFEEIRGKLRLPADIKPCIAQLLDGYSPLSRNGLTPFIVACELDRVGQNEGKIEALLIRLGVSQSKARNAVKSAATGRYSYGCPRLEVEGLCLYENRSECWWWQKIPKQSEKRFREWDFWRFGWPKRLDSAVALVYFAIGEIERRRGMCPGSCLFVSRKELAGIAGRSLPWVIKCCEKLKNVGLIDFKKGRQHRWYGQAGELRRVIPIPRPKVQRPIKR